MTARTVLPGPADGADPAAGEPSPGTADTGEGPEPQGPGLGERLGGRWRRARWYVAIAAVTLGTALILLTTLPEGTSGALDPDSPEPGGARAVAQILRGQGVEVTKAGRSREVARLATGGTTLVVISPKLLGPEQLDRIAATDADLVLVEPDAIVLNRLAPGIRPAGVVRPEVRPPDCSNPAARAAQDARAGGHVYRAPDDATLCYPADDDRAGSYVVTRDGGRTLTVVGQSEILTNERLAEDGNAALALRTLGADPRLIWYVPDPLELGATSEQPSTFDLLPRGVWWGAAQLAIAVLVALLWRARRLGALVSEPLPVVVRAAETEEGRARLYRQASARGRAAATLRTAALRRLASRLAVPTDATPEQVASLVAATTGRPDEAVRTTLLGPAPERDAALVALADDLDTLEREIAAHTQSLPVDSAPSRAGHRWDAPQGGGGGHTSRSRMADDDAAEHPPEPAQ